MSNRKQLPFSLFYATYHRYGSFFSHKRATDHFYRSRDPQPGRSSGEIDPLWCLDPAFLALSANGQCASTLPCSDLSAPVPAKFPQHRAYRTLLRGDRNHRILLLCQCAQTHGSGKCSDYTCSHPPVQQPPQLALSTGQNRSSHLACDYDLFRGNLADIFWKPAKRPAVW